MAKVISIGNQSFESIREKDNFYIDKTNFIREWWDNDDTVTLITRPRRFGKTLNMSMLECFFSNKYKDRGDLFEGLDIWKDEKYPGIVIEFKVINPRKENSLEETVKAALKQIEEKNYDAELVKRGVKEENIHHYGFAFRGKEVLIDGR